LNAPYQIETDLKDRTRDDYARYAPMWVGFVAKKGAAEAKELLDNKMIKAKQVLTQPDCLFLFFGRTEMVAETHGADNVVGTGFGAS
jgi:hypothetical protein